MNCEHKWCMFYLNSANMFSPSSSLCFYHSLVGLVFWIAPQQGKRSCKKPAPLSNWNRHVAWTRNNLYCVQFSSVQSLSRVQLFATPWMAARQGSLSITNSRSSLTLTSIESVMPSSHLTLCCPLLLLPPIPPSISLFQWVKPLQFGDLLVVLAFSYLSCLEMYLRLWLFLWV